MPALESSVVTAIEAMQQNVRDRLTDDMYAFYKDELGELAARKVSGWPPLDILSRYQNYKAKEYNAWRERYQAAKARQEEEWRAGEEKRAQRKGFFGVLGGMLGDALTGIGKAMSLPGEPQQMSDEEAMQDINLIQRYLRSVAQPGQKPLNLPPTVGRALLAPEMDSVRDTEVYNHLSNEWDKRGVEEIARVGNDQIYREVVQSNSYTSSEEEQKIRKQIKTIMQYLRQKSTQYQSNNKGRRY